MLELSKYRDTRHWAVYLDGELLCVTVYKRGVQAVIDALEDAAATSLVVAA